MDNVIGRQFFGEKQFQFGDHAFEIRCRLDQDIVTRPIESFVNGGAVAGAHFRNRSCSRFKFSHIPFPSGSVGFKVPVTHVVILGLAIGSEAAPSAGRCRADFVVAKMNMDSQDKMVPKKRGRPAIGHGVQIGLRLQPDLLAALDDWIAARPGANLSRPEAIRRVMRDHFDDVGIGMPNPEKS